MNSKKICFLVGSMAISGGTYVIVQHASYMRKKGYEVTLAVQEAFNAATLEWHDEAAKLRCISIIQAKQETYDLVIATWWKTVYELRDFNSTRFAYFVQSIESRFYSQENSALRQLVDETYHFPLSYATEASWIQEHLTNNFGQQAALIHNGIRKDIYKKEGSCIDSLSSRNKPRILIEGPFGVPFKNTAYAIRLAKLAGYRDIWVLTGSAASWLPGVKRVFSRVPMFFTPEIYRSCDILLKLSTVEGMFGPPLEMFHCGGTAVVFNVTGHDEYILDDVNACVVPRGDSDAVLQTLRRLLHDRSLLSRLKKGAEQTAQVWPDWEQSSMQFLDWIEDCLEKPIIMTQQLRLLTEAAYARYPDKSILAKKSISMAGRSKLRTCISHFFPKTVSRIKQIRNIREVLFGGKEAC